MNLLSVSVEAFTTFKRQRLNILLWFFSIFYLGNNKISYCFPGGAESTYQRWSLKTCSSPIPGLGRSPEGGNGNPLQCSCLENSMDRRAWRAPWGHKQLDTTEQLTLHLKNKISGWPHCLSQSDPSPSHTRPSSFLLGWTARIVMM